MRAAILCLLALLLCACSSLALDPIEGTWQESGNGRTTPDSSAVVVTASLNDGNQRLHVTVRNHGEAAVTVAFAADGVGEGVEIGEIVLGSLEDAVVTGRGHVVKPTARSTVPAPATPDGGERLWVALPVDTTGALVTVGSTTHYLLRITDENGVRTIPLQFVVVRRDATLKKAGEAGTGILLLPLLIPVLLYKAISGDWC